MQHYIRRDKEALTYDIPDLLYTYCIQPQRIRYPTLIKKKSKVITTLRIQVSYSTLVHIGEFSEFNTLKWKTDVQKNKINSANHCRHISISTRGKSEKDFALFCVLILISKSFVYKMYLRMQLNSILVSTDYHSIDIHFKSPRVTYIPSGQHSQDPYLRVFVYRQLLTRECYLIGMVQCKMSLRY